MPTSIERTAEYDEKNNGSFISIPIRVRVREREEQKESKKIADEETKNTSDHFVRVKLLTIAER